MANDHRPAPPLGPRTAGGLRTPRINRIARPVMTVTVEEAVLCHDFSDRGDRRFESRYLGSVK